MLRRFADSSVPRTISDTRRVDLAADRSGLPPSLVDAIEREGGLWWAGDAYTTAEAVVAAVREREIAALRLDFRDLSFLRSIPNIRYLHVRTDGRPLLDPIADLQELRALIIETSGVRGSLDPLAFQNIHWLRTGLGGKGAETFRTSIGHGHPTLEWLSVTETKAKRAVDLSQGFPSLRTLKIHFADYLRDLGPLAATTPTLEKVALNLTGIRSIDGLSGLRELRTLEIVGGRISDLSVLASLPSVEFLRLEARDVTSLEPLRGHPALRMLLLNVADDTDVSVLNSLPRLEAVTTGGAFKAETKLPDQNALPIDHPLRREWQQAMRE